MPLLSFPLLPYFSDGGKSMAHVIPRFHALCGQEKAFPCFSFFSTDGIPSWEKRDENFADWTVQTSRKENSFKTGLTLTGGKSHRMTS